MKTLDLHGVRHQDVDERVRKFLNFATMPCQIITGNSPEMKQIVSQIVKEYKWFCYEKDAYNYGVMIIVEETLW